METLSALGPALDTGFLVRSASGKSGSSLASASEPAKRGCPPGTAPQDHTTRRDFEVLLLKINTAELPLLTAITAWPGA